MLGSFQTGISGLQQFQQDLEVIGNNIANVNTVGYKTSHMEFKDALSQSLAGGTSAMQVGNGVSAAAINSEFSQGTINTTGTPTDLAISGEGFFVVKDVSSGGSFVTRDGEFLRDANGYLVTNSGMRVQGYVGAGAPYAAGSPTGDIQISDAAAIAALGAGGATPAPTIASWSIDAAGNVNVILSDSTFSGTIAQVVLQNFSNPQALMKQGNNIYAFSSNSGPLANPVAPQTAGLGQIYSGALEQSNVDIGNEMAAMITAQRAFEANGKIITTSDEILQDLVNLKR